MREQRGFAKARLARAGVHICRHAGQIAEQLGISPATLSFHLKELAHADLVTASKAGRSIIYAANYAGMNGLLAFLTENCCAGAPCCVSEPYLLKETTT